MSKNKNLITVMWAHPRSMSTAMERMMRERGDCDCLHEPFMYFYYVHLARKKMPFFDAIPSHPVKFEDIVSQFHQRAESRPVFVKDMAYYVIPEILSHPDLAKNINHVFLVRDPHRSIASYFQLDQGIRSEEIGINAQWRLFQWIEDLGGATPLVLSAEHVQSNPELAAVQLWQYLGLIIKSEALEWNNSETPDEWNQVATWHRKTMLTSGIRKDNTDSKSAQQHFQSLAAKHPKLEKMLADHLDAYRSLKTIADRQWRCHLEAH